MTLNGSPNLNEDTAMKDIKELRLEFAVSDIILELVRQDLYNALDNSDLQGVCHVKAMEIIKIVREAE